MLLVFVLPLGQQFLPLHEGVVELFIRVGKNHLVVEFRHHRLSFRPKGMGAGEGRGKKRRAKETTSVSFLPLVSLPSWNGLGGATGYVSTASRAYANTLRTIGWLHKSHNHLSLPLR